MSEQHKTDFLGRDAIFPLLMKLGIPAVVGMLVNALYNIVDTIFVGHGVGPLAIAALAIVFPLQMLVSAFAQAIGVGAASIVSRRLGEKRTEDAAEAMGTAYTAVLVVTAVIVAVIFAFTRPILAAFGASEAVMPFAMEYLRIVAVGFFFFSLSMAANNLVRAEGNAKASMVGMIIGAALNTVLDPLFIFGFGWGVAGAAWATVLSQIASCAYLYSLYPRKRAHVPIALRHFRIKAAVLGESVVLGVPSFINAAGMSLLGVLIITTLGRYGGDESITVYGMVQKMTSLAIMPVLGITQGFQPIAGYNYGARRFDRVKRALWTGVLTAIASSLVGYSILMLFPRFVMGLFTTDALLAEKAAYAVRIMVLCIPAAALQITSVTYFQAVGKRVASLLLGTSRQFLILVPIIVVLPIFLGTDGVWLAYPIADALAVLITTPLLIREVRRLRGKHEDELGLNAAAAEPAPAALD